MLVPVDVPGDVELGRPACAQLGTDAREPLLEDAGPGHEEQVGMAALRDELAGLGGVGERVAVEHLDVIEPIGQDAGGAQTGHAGADDDGRATGPTHRHRLGHGRARSGEPVGTRWWRTATEPHIAIILRGVPRR
jgi:hypothetical protein